MSTNIKICFTKDMESKLLKCLFSFLFPEKKKKKLCMRSVGRSRVREQIPRKFLIIMWNILCNFQMLRSGDPLCWLLLLG